METVIEMKNIEKQYDSGENTVKALNGVNLTVKKGEFVAIVGRSGSGKSTLMHILGCLDLPTKGEYALNGEKVKTLSEGRLSHLRNRSIGFVFQSFHLLPNLTAAENVELPLLYGGMSRQQRKELALQLLEQVGLSDRAHHYPTQMSGGQQQRVAIARAVAGSPPLLLADEPTGNLDEQSGKDVMALLHRLHQSGTTILLITHDPLVAKQAGRQLEMREGRLF
jgi:putative ABC transport system ATP-binding protein